MLEEQNQPIFRPLASIQSEIQRAMFLERHFFSRLIRDHATLLQIPDQNETIAEAMLNL